jgi:hypothetical protein
MSDTVPFDCANSPAIYASDTPASDYKRSSVYEQNMTDYFIFTEIIK